MSSVSTIVILLLAMLIFVCVPLLIKEKEPKKTVMWMIQNDPTVFKTILSLSYLANMRSHHRFISRKSVLLNERLLERLRYHMPDRSEDEIIKIHAEILDIVTKVAQKRRMMSYE